MWQPEPAWERLPGGPGSSGGIWRTGDGRVVKRLLAPGPGDPDALTDPTSPVFWRREAEAATSGLLQHTPGLRAPTLLDIEEDGEGVTLTHAEVADDRPNGLFGARALGLFAGAAVRAPWLASRQLRFRLERTAARGGWSLLARTPLSDLAAHVWERRHEHLAALHRVPLVLQHGDPVPANLRGVDGESIVAVDWSTVGLGPVGGDLGYWSLSAREGFEHLLTAYLGGLPADTATRDEVLLGARVTAAFTVLGRADWALSRVADGEGPLGGRLRHPSVAPYLRSLQRAFDRIEPLLSA